MSYLDDNPQISYGHTARIQELAEADERWLLVRHNGAGAFNKVYFPDELQESLGVDLMAADTMFTVENVPGAITLVDGGQDPDSVRAAAVSSGWNEENGVFVTERRSDDRVTESANQVEVDGESVRLGEKSADLDRFNGSSRSIYDAGYGLVVSCLGDPVAARVLNTDEVGEQHQGEERAYGPLAVGVLDSAGIQSVMCVESDDPTALSDAILNDLATHTGHLLAETPLSDLFSDVEITIEGNLVKAIFDHTEVANADELLGGARVPGPPGFR